MLRVSVGVTRRTGLESDFSGFGPSRLKESKGIGFESRSSRLDKRQSDSNLGDVENPILGLPV